MKLKFYNQLKLSAFHDIFLMDVYSMEEKMFMFTAEDFALQVLSEMHSARSAFWIQCGRQSLKV